MAIWTRRFAQSTWLDSAVSYTGQNIVVSDASGVYQSSDYGANWTKVHNKQAKLSINTSDISQETSIEIINKRALVEESASGIFLDSIIPNSTYLSSFASKVDQTKNATSILDSKSSANPSRNVWTDVVSSWNGYKTIVCTRNGYILKLYNADNIFLHGAGPVTCFKIGDYPGLRIYNDIKLAVEESWEDITPTGSLWNNDLPPGMGFADCVALAASYGCIHIVALRINGVIARSSNSGETWTVTNLPYYFNEEAGISAFYKDICCSKDGSILAAAQYDGKIHVSINYGNTWTAKTTDKKWKKIDISEDGRTIVAIVENGKIYISNDSGETWTEHEQNRDWSSISISKDGKFIVATAYDGHIYVSSLSEPDRTDAKLILRFNENDQSTTTVDSSPNNNAITLLNGAKVVNKSLFFDGVNDYAVITANNSLSLDSTDYTIEFWLNLSSSSGLRYILAKSGTPEQFSIRINTNNKLEFVSTFGSVVSNQSISTGIWTHVAIVLQNEGTSALPASSGMGTIFINGNYDNSSTLTIRTSNISDASNIFLAQNQNNQNRTSAFIDDLVIYKKTTYIANFIPSVRSSSVLLNTSTTTTLPPLIRVGNPITATTSTKFAVAQAINSNGNVVVLSEHPVQSNLPDADQYRLSVWSYNGINWQKLGNTITDFPVFIRNERIALNGIGNILALGYPQDQNVKLYGWNGTSWNQIGNTIVAPNSDWLNFGSVISLNASGNKIAVGAGHVSGSGSIMVYDYDGYTWNQTSLRPIDESFNVDLVAGEFNLIRRGLRGLEGYREPPLTDDSTLVPTSTSYIKLSADGNSIAILGTAKYQIADTDPTPYATSYLANSGDTALYARVLDFNSATDSWTQRGNLIFPPLATATSANSYTPSASGKFNLIPSNARCNNFFRMDFSADGNSIAVATDDKISGRGGFAKVYEWKKIEFTELTEAAANYQGTLLNSNSDNLNYNVQHTSFDTDPIYIWQEKNLNYPVREQSDFDPATCAYFNSYRLNRGITHCEPVVTEIGWWIYELSINSNASLLATSAVNPLRDQEGELLASGIQILEFNDITKKYTIKHRIPSAAAERPYIISSDGSRIVVGQEDGSVAIYSLLSEPETSTSTTLPPVTSSTTSTTTTTLGPGQTTPTPTSTTTTTRAPSDPCNHKQYSVIQIRRGSSSSFNSSNVVLASGEPAYAIDTKVFKIGDGITPWNNLQSPSGIGAFNNNSGGGGVLINNSGDNRILTSTGSTSGIYAESNFTFDGVGLYHSAGNFANDKDAQHSIFVARRITTDATANVVLTLDGNAPTSSNILIIPAQTSWTFSIKLSAYNSADNQSAWWIIRGGIRRNAANQTALIGSIITESGSETTLNSASATVVANDTNESLEIRVTGISSKTIRWVAVAEISQVSFGTP